jgi:hypothetical protein
MIKVTMAGEDEVDLATGSESCDKPLDGRNVGFSGSSSREAHARKSLLRNACDVSVCEDTGIPRLEQPIRH